MTAWIVEGELGQGKSILALSRMQQALHDGRRVATNFDLKLEHLVGPNVERNVTRVPDCPTSADVRALGKGYIGRQFSEKRFGLLVLDEAAVFINGRGWNGDADMTKDEKRAAARERMDLLWWLRHSRKFRWDLILITQDVESLDAQARRSLGQYVVEARRLDNFNVPGLSYLVKLCGLKRLPLPQVHFGIVRRQGHNVDQWWLPDGKALYKAYNTEQKLEVHQYPAEALASPMAHSGAATMLDHRKAPYLWRPSGWYPLLRKALLHRLGFGPSQAECAHLDFRLYEEEKLAPYKPPVITFRQWDSARRVCVTGDGLRAWLGQLEVTAGGHLEETSRELLADAAD